MPPESQPNHQSTIQAIATGKRVTLRPLTPDDVTPAGYLAWMNDTEVVRYTEARFATYTLESLRAFVQATTANPKNVFLAILAPLENDPAMPRTHIGNIKLGPIDWHHRSGDIGIIIGDQRAWGRGYATEAISLLSDLAFNRLGLHKLTASCYATNAGSAKAFRKAGFSDEGLKRSQSFSEGKYVDLILLGRVNPTEQ